MRRDEYLNKLESEKANSIPKSIFSEVCTQWEKAGFDYKTLTDENGNWFIEHVDGESASNRINALFHRMTDFWVHDLNCGINTGSERWYTKEEAIELSSLFLRKCIPYDYRVEYYRNGDVNPKFPYVIYQSGSTLQKLFNITPKKRVPVYHGWTAATENEVRELFTKALASVILDNIKYAYEHFNSFEEYFKDELEFQKGKPHIDQDDVPDVSPYMVDEHYHPRKIKVEWLGTDGKESTYYCKNPDIKCYKDRRISWLGVILGLFIMFSPCILMEIDVSCSLILVVFLMALSLLVIDISTDGLLSGV